MDTEWDKMSERCFLEASAVLRTFESLFSETFKKVLEGELEKRGEKGEIQTTDRYAAADEIFRVGIVGAMYRLSETRATGPEAVASFLLNFAKETNYGEEEHAEAFGAAIQNIALIMDREAVTRLPNSREALLSAQEFVGACLGMKLPRDTLLPETRHLLIVARHAIRLSTSEGLENILGSIPLLSNWPKQDEYFVARTGKYKVIGIMWDDDRAYVDEGTLEYAIELASVPEARFIGKVVYDDQGLEVW